MFVSGLRVQILKNLYQKTHLYTKCTSGFSGGGVDVLPFEHLLAWLDQLRQAFEEDNPDAKVLNNI